MKKLFAIAAFLLASTAAQAQYTFEYGGRTIHIDPDRGTVSIPGVYDNSGRRSKRSHNDQDSDRQRKQAPQQAKVEPQAPAVDAPPADQAPALAPANNMPEPSTATANVAPADTATAPPPAPSAPAPQVQQDAAPVAKPAPAPVVATAPVAAPIQKQQTPAPTPAVQAANTPLGVWLTEEKGQGPDRAVRRQSLWVFGGHEIKPERRTGFDQHEAQQRRQVERANSRPEHRQHL